MREPTIPAGQLHVLLWHYFTSSPYPSPSGCHQEFIDDLLQLELIEHAPDRDELEITDKGRAYIDAILRLPLPVRKWVMP